MIAAWFASLAPLGRHRQPVLVLAFHPLMDLLLPSEARHLKEGS